MKISNGIQVNFLLEYRKPGKLGKPGLQYTGTAYVLIKSYKVIFIYHSPMAIVRAVIYYTLFFSGVVVCSSPSVRFAHSIEFCTVGNTLGIMFTDIHHMVCTFRW